MAGDVDVLAQLKAMLEQKAQPCPSCGHCPTCGRGAQPYFAPWTYPRPWITWTTQPSTWTWTTHNEPSSTLTSGFLAEVK